MQDALLKLYSSYAYKTFDNTGTVTAVSAGSAITDSAGNTGFKQILNTNRNPYPNPLWLSIMMPGVSGGGGITTTNGPSAAKITFTVTVSTDGGSDVGIVLTSRTVSVAITSNAGVAPGQMYIPLPPFKEGYIKVAWATTFTGGASPTAAWGLLDVSLELAPDLNFATDIG